MSNVEQATDWWTRSRAIALAAALVVLGSLSAARADALDDAIADCYATELATLQSSDPGYVTDLLGALHEARLLAQCTKDVAELAARGEILTEIDLDPIRLNSLSKSGRKATGFLTRAIESAGSERFKWVKKAHKSVRSFELIFDQSDLAAFDVNGALLAAEGAEVLRLSDAIVALQQEVVDADQPENAKLQKGTGFLVVADALLEEAAGAVVAASEQLAAAVAARVDGQLSETERQARVKEAGRAYRQHLKSYFKLLSTALRAIGKGEKLIRKELERLFECPLSDPDDPFDGGGFVTLSIDRGPEITVAGETGLSIFSATRQFVQFGTQSQAETFVSFHHEGPFFHGKGTYSVEFLPSAIPQDFKKDFVSGFFRTEPLGRGTLYKFVSGTFTLATYKLSRKNRLATGSFDVIAAADGVPDVRVTGTFHLCRFAIERKGSIDFPK